MNYEQGQINYNQGVKIRTLFNTSNISVSLLRGGGQRSVLGDNGALVVIDNKLQKLNKIQTTSACRSKIINHELIQVY